MAKKQSLHDMLRVVADVAEEQGASEAFLEHLRWTAQRSHHAKNFENDDLVQLALGIKEREYRGFIDSAAKGIVDEADGDEEAAQERASETADGAHCVIYTHEAILTLLSTRNEEAWFDQGLGELGDSFGEAVTRLAFAAVEQDLLEDISEEMERRADEEPEDGEDEDEEPEE